MIRLSVDLVILVLLWVMSVMLIVVRHASSCVVVNCVYIVLRFRRVACLLVVLCMLVFFCGFPLVR